MPESTEGEAEFNQIIDLMKEFVNKNDLFELTNLRQRLSNKDQREKANQFARTGNASEIVEKSKILSELDNALSEYREENPDIEKVKTEMEAALRSGGFL